MPNQDRTGPRGEGSLTGRGLGPCGKGRAVKRGFGRGAGFRNAEPVTLTKEEQKKILEAEKREIEKKIKELEE
ncbi:MAG: DUF5320 domain-containing protein [archaeon]|nr:DUF5320 domain-containing protein [archaeon]